MFNIFLMVFDIWGIQGDSMSKPSPSEVFRLVSDNAPADLRKLSQMMKGRPEGRLLERADVIEYLLDQANEPGRDPLIAATLMICARTIVRSEHVKKD